MKFQVMYLNYKGGSKGQKYTSFLVVLFLLRNGLNLGLVIGVAADLQVVDPCVGAWGYVPYPPSFSPKRYK